MKPAKHMVLSYTRYIKKYGITMSMNEFLNKFYFRCIDCHKVFKHKNGNRKIALCKECADLDALTCK